MSDRGEADRSPSFAEGQEGRSEEPGRKSEGGLDNWSGFAERLEEMAMDDTPEQTPSRQVAVVDKSPKKAQQSRLESEYTSQEDKYYGEGYGSGSSDEYGSPSKRVLLGERSNRKKPRQRKLVGEVKDLKLENQQLREMLIQNGLFMRITHGLHELGLEAPPDMKDKTVFSAAKNFRVLLDSQIPQAHKMAKVWTERGSRIADQERRTHHCLQVNALNVLVCVIALHAFGSCAFSLYHSPSSPTLELASALVRVLRATSHIEGDVQDAAQSTREGNRGSDGQGNKSGAHRLESGAVGREGPAGAAPFGVSRTLRRIQPGTTSLSPAGYSFQHRSQRRLHQSPNQFPNRIPNQLTTPSANLNPCCAALRQAVAQAQVLNKEHQASLEANAVRKDLDVLVQEDVLAIRALTARRSLGTSTPRGQMLNLVGNLLDKLSLEEEAGDVRTRPARHLPHSLAGPIKIKILNIK
eukprot:1181337-Prorocentrum_minimum.AAC.3